MKNAKLLQLLSEENDIISVVKLVQRKLSICYIDLPDFEFRKTKYQNWM